MGNDTDNQEHRCQSSLGDNQECQHPTSRREGGTGCRSDRSRPEVGIKLLKIPKEQKNKLQSQHKQLNPLNSKNRLNKSLESCLLALEFGKAHCESTIPENL